MFLFQTALPIVGDMGMLLKVPLLNMQQMLNINSMNYDEQNKKINKRFTVRSLPKKFPLRCISAKLLQTLKPDISNRRCLKNLFKTLFPSVRLCVDLKTDLTPCNLEEAFSPSIKP